MYVIESEAQFIYASITETGRALVSFKDLLFSGDDPYSLLEQFTNATAALRKSLDEYEANQTEDPTPQQTTRPVPFSNRATRSTDIEDVNAGDQIRVGGWWHKVAEVNERRFGITIKTTRNEWFAFDHGDRVTVAMGAEDE